jgi:hypothetical protein
MECSPQRYYLEYRVTYVDTAGGACKCLKNAAALSRPRFVPRLRLKAGSVAYDMQLSVRRMCIE